MFFVLVYTWDGGVLFAVNTINLDAKWSINQFFILHFFFKKYFHCCLFFVFIVTSPKSTKDLPPIFRIK